MFTYRAQAWPPTPFAREPPHHRRKRREKCTLQQSDLPVDNAIGAHFAEIPKYVASRVGLEASWDGSTVLTGPDVTAQIDALRDRHREVHVIGSIDFVQTLLAAGLYDELKLWVHPVVLGEGKRVFPSGAAPTTLRLLAPAVSGPSGTLLLRYAPGGEVVAEDLDPEG